MQATATAPSSQDLPQQMLAAKRWLLWKRNKAPFYANGKPRNGKLDSPKDTAQLALFEDAVAALNHSPTRYAGLGFALGDGWQGIDLDGVRDPDTGKLVDWAEMLVERAKRAGSYIEVSPSGRGLHIIGYGDPLPTMGSNGSGVECYCSGRYFTVTGKRLNGLPSQLLTLATVYDFARMQHSGSKTAQEPRTDAGGGVTPISWASESRIAPRLLQKLDPDMGYTDWVKVGMALHHASGGAQDALELWRDWSERGAKYVEGDCDKRWAGFKDERQDSVTFETLARMTREADVKRREAIEREADENPFEIITGDALIAKNFVPPEEVITGRIRLTPGAHLLAGKPKRGKSWLTMGLLLAACTGDEYLESRASKPMQALYIACDDSSQARFSERIKAFKAIAPLAGFALITKFNKLARSMLDVLGELLEGNPHLRIMAIDTLSAFRNSQRTDNPYQQEYDELHAINDWAHKHNVVVIVVHHLRKGEVDPSDPFEAISGTLGLQGAVDGMMVIERKDLKSDFDEALDEKLAGFWARSRDVEDEYSFGMRLHDGRWRMAGHISDVFHASTKREILNVLEEHRGEWMTSKEIHAAGSFTCKADGVKMSCIRMAKRDEIESHRGAQGGKSGGGGGFRLPPKK